MNKNLFTILFAIFVAVLLASCDRNDDNNPIDEPQQPRRGGVVINGVEWARSNVAMPGTFAQNPQDAGMFFLWNCRIGWSSTDPMVNSDGGDWCSRWGSSPHIGTAWYSQNDPCPTGWRIPTVGELSSLRTAGS